MGADVYDSNCQKIKYDCFVDLHNYWQRKPPNKQNGAHGYNKMNFIWLVGGLKSGSLLLEFTSSFMSCLFDFSE